MDQLGRSTVRLPQWLLGRLLDGVQDAVNRIRIHVPLRPLRLLSATLTASSLPQVVLLVTQFSGWGEEEMGLLGSISLGWGI